MAIFFSILHTTHCVLPPTNVYVNAPTRLVHRAREISHDDRAIHPATTLVFYVVLRPTVAAGIGNEKCDRIDFICGPCRTIEAEEMNEVHAQKVDSVVAVYETMTPTSTYGGHNTQVCFI